MQFDLSDPGLLLREDVLDDPRPFYDTLRREAPVWKIPGQDTYLVSDPALIRDAVGRPDDFSSNIVSLLHDDGNSCPVPFRISRYRDPIHVLSTADPPLHTRHRKLLQPLLSPAAVADLEPAVAQIVDTYLTPVLAAGRLDIVAAFSDPVPARTICELLGLPAEDVPQVLAFTLGTGALLDGVTDLDGMGRAVTSAVQLAVFAAGRLDEALDLPPAERSGLLGVFAGLIETGELTRDEVVSMLTVFVTAGSETTASLIAIAIETLALDAELQDRLRARPEDIPGALEDILRASGPFQFHYRYAPADTTLGSTEIPARSRVLLMWAAANRPEPGAPEPSEADEPGRTPPHFAFGRGIHFCIGAPVARLEARVAIEQLLARTTSVRLDPDHPPTRRPSIFIRRHATLPVVVDPSLPSDSAPLEEP
jgi:cytochrome P450